VENDAKPYSKRLISRMVRIVRDPLDNVVSRFHHARKEDKNLAKRYPDHAKGFHRFCKEQLHVYRKQEEEYFNKTLLSLFQGIPCYADFYRYAMWHNYAESLVHSYNVSSLLIHYEDYDCTRGGNETMNQLLEFLNLSPYVKSSFRCDFKSGKSYHDYYSKEEMERIWLLLQQVVSIQVWGILERYYNQMTHASEGGP